MLKTKKSSFLIVNIKDSFPWLNLLQADINISFRKTLFTKQNS